MTGLIAQHAKLGGVTWDYLNFVLGIHALGAEVYYVEDSGQWPYNFDGGANGRSWVAANCSENVAELDRVFQSIGLGDRWAYRFPVTGEWFGLSDTIRHEIVRTADVLLNVSGSLERPELYRSVSRLVYIDTDPAFTQISVLTGDEQLRSRIEAHDYHFSLGENVSSCRLGTDHNWRPIKHPVYLPAWAHSLPCRDAFTTVMNWTSYCPVTYEGQVFGQKDMELIRFLDLPTRVHQVRLEVAMPNLVHSAWEYPQSNWMRGPFGTPQMLLRHHGWHPVDSIEACGDHESYHAYIISSKAEWSVAKNGYVNAHVGWFSGRSACYLAAGRPVVVQDTGIRQHLPTGLGVFAFSDINEAAAAIDAVIGAYPQHAKAAKEIAEAYFDSDKILEDLITVIQ